MNILANIKLRIRKMRTGAMFFEEQHTAFEIAQFYFSAFEKVQVLDAQAPFMLFRLRQQPEPTHVEQRRLCARCIG